MARVDTRKLKLLRVMKGCSQEELAELAGLKSGTIYKLERGKNHNPGLKTLSAIARVLGVHVVDLIIED